MQPALPKALPTSMDSAACSASSWLWAMMTPLPAASLQAMPQSGTITVTGLLVMLSYSAVEPDPAVLREIKSSTRAWKACWPGLSQVVLAEL